MTFDDDLEQMKEIFEDTERQFIEFTRIIPIDNPSDMYSTRLYSLLQHICGQIESLMRIYCDKMNLQYESRNFPSYFQALNSNRMLEKQKVLLIKTKSIINPFFPKNHSTEWWHSYNDTKHQLPQGLKQGNLGNTISALAGLYLLHSMKKYFDWGIPSEKLLDHHSWQDEDEKISDKLLIHHLQTSEGISKFFYNLSHYFGNEQGLKWILSDFGQFFLVDVCNRDQMIWSESFIRNKSVLSLQMSYIEIALRTEQAKQSYRSFFVKLFQTWDLDQSFDALESEARRNGAWETAKLALAFDFLSGLAKRF